jgi:hypothetical protein
MAKNKKAERVKKQWLGKFSKHVAKNLAAVPPPPAKKPGGVQKQEKSKKERKRLAAKARAIPYRPGQSILVIGDGNFSWSAGLCERLKDGTKVVATCFDSEKDLKVRRTRARAVEPTSFPAP